MTDTFWTLFCTAVCALCEWFSIWGSTWSTSFKAPISFCGQVSCLITRGQDSAHTSVFFSARSYWVHTLLLRLANRRHIAIRFWGSCSPSSQHLVLRIMKYTCTIFGNFFPNWWLVLNEAVGSPLLTNFASHWLISRFGCTVFADSDSPQTLTSVNYKRIAIWEGRKVVTLVYIYQGIRAQGYSGQYRVDFFSTSTEWPQSKHVRGV